MKLTISYPGLPAETREGSQKQLFDVVADDLSQQGCTRSEIQKHLFSLGRMSGGVGGTVLKDESGNLEASYRITR